MHDEVQWGYDRSVTMGGGRHVNLLHLGTLKQNKTKKQVQNKHQEHVCIPNFKMCNVKKCQMLQNRPTMLPLTLLFQG